MLREFMQSQGKAFPYVPQLTDAGGPLLTAGEGYYGAYNPYVSGAQVAYGRVTTPLSQREAGVHAQTYGGSEGIDWLFSAVNYIIEGASAASYHFEDENGVVYAVEKKPTDPPSLQAAPYMLSNLFNSPNPYMSYEDLLELTLIDFLVLGNAYWVKWKTNSQKQPAALYRMAPQFVRIVPDEYGPSKYLYKLPMMAQEIQFTPDQVVHFRRPNPLDPYYGMGIVKGAARALDMELALTNTMAHYYENRALPSGVVSTTRRVPRDVFQKLKSQLNSFYTGSNKAGKLMVLEAGLTWQDVSPTAADALFQQMGGWSRDRVLAMFKLNKGLLGMWEGQGDPSLDAWQALFDQKTMIPLTQKFSKMVSNAITKPGWGFKFVIDYEETQAPDQVIQRATLLSAMPGVKVHELRAASGLPPSTGDEAVDNMVLNLPGPNMDGDGDGGTADRNLPGEAGRPPLPESTQAISGRVRKSRGVLPAVAGGNAAAHVKAILDRIDDQIKALPPARTHIGEIMDVTPPEDKLFSERITAVDNLVADMTRDIQAAAHDLERALLDASEGKAEGTMYQRVKNSKGWAQFRAKLTAILESGAQRAISLANIQHSKAGFAPNLDADYAALAKAQIGREDGGVLSIVKNFKAELLHDVLSLQRHGSNPGEFTKSIMAVTNKWSAGHAKTVALTEVTRAYNEGTIQVAENGNYNLLVSDGTDNDEPCIEANGSVWTPEYAREHYLEHPNCRRAFVPTTEKAQ